MQDAVIVRCQTGSIDVFQAIVELDKLSSLTSKQRKEKGVFYTPREVSDFIVKKLDIKPDESVVDPACGHGAFLFSLLEQMREYHQLHGKALLDWFTNQVKGVDINAQAVWELRELLSAWFHVREGLEVGSNRFSNIDIRDALIGSSLEADVMLGNPPYIRAKHLEENYLKTLRENYLSCSKGNVDIYYAFLEMAAKQASRFSFIVPNTYQTNLSAHRLRGELKNKATLILDFGQKQVFPGVGTYTSILFGAQDASDKTFEYGQDFDESSWQALPRKRLDDSPWRLREPERSRECRLLGDLCNVYFGVGTLKDKVYIHKTDQVENSGKSYQRVSFNGKPYLIEWEATRPFLKLTKVKDKKQVQDSDFRILYPYDKNGQIIPEETLSTRFPGLYRFFIDTRKVLSTRDKGKTEHYEAWYAYGRRQGLYNLGGNRHFLTVPRTVASGYQPVSFQGKEVDGPIFLFASGFIVEPIGLGVQQIHDILSSEDFFSYLSARGQAWKGKQGRPHYFIRASDIREYPIPEE